MKMTFTNKKCKNCFIRLTEFEAGEKQGLCMDCYKEEHDEPKKKVIKPKPS